MKKLLILIASSMLMIMLMCPVVARADTSSLTTDLPDFAKAVSENTSVDLSKYPYYVVHYYKKPDGIVYDCLFISSSDYVKYYSGCGVGKNLWKDGNTVYGDITSGNTYGVRYRTYTNQYVFDAFGSLTFFELFDAEVSEGGILYSNFNIINSSDGSVFFQATPLLSYPTSIGETITAQTVTAALIKEWIGVAPLVIGLSLLAISLWKGLRFLLIRLRQA